MPNKYTLIWLTFFYCIVVTNVFRGDFSENKNTIVI